MHVYDNEVYQVLSTNLKETFYLKEMEKFYIRQFNV
jgi:hypothetical protein